MNKLFFPCVFLSFFLSSVFYQLKAQGDYDIQVTLLNDSTFETQSDLLEDKDTEKPFIFRNNCEQIFAYQTKKISLINKKDEKFTGITFGDQWYFPLQTGKLNCYSSYIASQKLKYLYFMQKGESNLQPYDRAYLKKVFSDHPEAKKELNAHFALRTLQKVLMYGGIALSVGALALPANKAFDLTDKIAVGNPELCLFTGIVVASSSGLLERPQRKKLTKSIEVLNRE